MLAGIGTFLFGRQFVFLFFAMQAGLPPGLTSRTGPAEGPLTVVLAALFLPRACHARPMAGARDRHRGCRADRALWWRAAPPLFALLLALMSALTWATGNLFFRTARVSMFAVTAWACLLPTIAARLVAPDHRRPDGRAHPGARTDLEGLVRVSSTPSRR